MNVTVRVDIEPEVLEWATARSGLDREEILRHFPRFDKWVGRDGPGPTLRQLESFAQRTHTPVGMLLLPTPPRDELPVPDYRTFGDAGVREPSADLLDAVFLCEQRQDWYRDYALSVGEDPRAFVGSVGLGSDPVVVADSIRAALGFQVEQRRSHPTWTEALRALIDLTENIGILVMVSGIVGANTHRKLDPAEFRGFALVDDIAPLIFINGVDTKAAQIFTLAHEVAHVWLGQSAVSNPRLDRPNESNETERWCDSVAAEVLVPVRSFQERFNPRVALDGELQRLAREYKVSTLVILRRAYDAGFLTWDAYRDAYKAELDRVMEIVGQEGKGGDFYNTQPLRASRRFSRAIIASTLEGRTLYRDAFRLLGLRKTETFEKLGQALEVS
ncbi:MAG TPA: ImmA/IrrE family metallo-endopeptidase [Baekduia sp.]|uniref:ImmA/IrrE family metallo-endopeptidase n=1 Tax=Baekduia sp. TaxID=2600305 RepID=UPI002D7655E0|nr:ImmA/IrrE family metallo-endopeptidase [Baekduia sp.]HET6505607.1 ImmA/IrrE family metallo-endopeptidase [Baekduia sp.]